MPALTPRQVEANARYLEQLRNRATPIAGRALAMARNDELIETSIHELLGVLRLNGQRAQRLCATGHDVTDDFVNGLLGKDSSAMTKGYRGAPPPQSEELKVVDIAATAMLRNRAVAITQVREIELALGFIVRKNYAGLATYLAGPSPDKGDDTVIRNAYLGEGRPSDIHAGQVGAAVAIACVAGAIIDSQSPADQFSLPRIDKNRLYAYGVSDPMEAGAITGYASNVGANLKRWHSLAPRLHHPNSLAVHFGGTLPNLSVVPRGPSSLAG